MNKTTMVQCAIKYIDYSGEFSANKILREISVHYTLLNLQNAEFDLVKFEHLYSFAKQLRIFSMLILRNAIFLKFFFSESVAPFHILFPFIS